MPKQRISLMSIKPLVKSPASQTKIFLWDTEVRGFGVYKNSQGRPVFVYQYRFDGGKSQRVTLGELGELTVERARTFASDLAYERRTGSDPIAKRKQTRAAADAETGLVVSIYFENYLERRRTGDDPMSSSQTAVFRRDLIAPFGHIRLDTMTTEDVDTFRAAMFERGPSMARSGLVCLNTLINDAIWRGKLVRRDAHAFEVPKVKKRERRLDEWETCRLIEAAYELGGPRRDVIEVLIRMAKRKEEVAELPWEEIDLSERLWRLPAERTKNKKAQLIVLPTQVCRIIESQQPDPSKRTGPVFTIDGLAPVEMGSQVKDILDGYLQRRAELADARDGTTRRVAHYTVHDLRKIASSRLAEKPFMFSRDLINAMLLHTNGSELDGVYILTQLVQETGDMVQRWNDHVDGLMAGNNMWPGGRELPPMEPSERIARLAKLRVGWPKTAAQARAEAARKAGTVKKKLRKKVPKG